MQNFVIETVIAALLVLLLWSMDHGRSDLRFRFWVIGWSLVLVHFVSLLWHPTTAIGSLVQQAELASLEVLTGVCFLLSDPAVMRNRRRLIRTAYLGTLPALFSGFVILFQPVNLWVIYLAVVMTHALAIIFARQYVGQRIGKFFPLAAIYFLSASWMMGALAQHKPELVLASIPAELFLINAVLFSRNYSLRNPGNIIAVTGFVLWAWSSFFTISLRHLGAADALLPNILNLPQFLVAIGMTMIILEQDAILSSELVMEYELLFNNNPFPLWIYDLKSLRFLSANPASAKAYGYSVEELCRRKLTDLMHPDMMPDLQAGLARTSHYALHVRKDGSTLPVNVTAYDVRFRGRAACIALAEDITEREQMASQLMYQVQHDLLTGLPNRTTFLRKLEEVFISANCDDSGCAVIVFQINRFERVNEKYGHGVGDQLLKETAKLLQSQLHTQDVIGRTGSREFMIALASVQDGVLAQARAKELLRIFDKPILVDEHRIEVFANMGLAVFPEDSDNTSALLRDASHARALAQSRGSNNFVRLSRKLSLEAQEESRIESVLQQALINERFEVFYQPITDSNGELFALEALLRLHDDDGSHISPSRFIPIAETTGAITSIGRWVVSEVCRQLKQWQDAGLRVAPVAINVSALQIVQTTFCADITSTLDQFNIDPALIHLELTESSVMPQGPLALENMLKLAAAGISFSIDDFGTGFSSLDRLHQLPVSTLKIDRTFVSRMLDTNGTLPIVSTIISMAHSLKVGVIAEGVETQEQFRALHEMGCDQFQGFFFGRPVDAVAAAKILSQESRLLTKTRNPATDTSSSVLPFRAIQTGTSRW